MRHVIETLDGSVESSSAKAMRWMPPELAILVRDRELSVVDAARSLGLPSEVDELVDYGQRVAG